jgi:hypothetical protein
MARKMSGKIMQEAVEETRTNLAVTSSLNRLKGNPVKVVRFNKWFTTTIQH